MKKLTPNLIVDKIEDSLPFWVDRLGFEKMCESDGDVAWRRPADGSPLTSYVGSPAAIAAE